MAKIWLLLGLAAFGAAFVAPPQPGIEDIQQTGLLVLACLFLFLWGLGARKRPKPSPRRKKSSPAHRAKPKPARQKKTAPARRAKPAPRKKAKKPTRPIMVDGSNVMHWKDGAPDLEIVKQLVTALKKAGYQPGVIFDANAGYKLFDRYLDDAPLARELGLPEKQVLVSPKGQPADVFLLNAARDMGAPIVTNDRFRDWLDDFPEFAKPGRLIQGGYRNDAPYLKSNAR
ncbi:MAG: hypothetical protein OQK05_07840 [Pseudopelagicola sp.]|nr:hypothetical protein [Pseudopelagicola sp.]